MRMPTGGAAHVAAIVEAHEKASRAWSRLSPEIQRSSEGQELKERLDAAGANLAILQELTADHAKPVIPRRPVGLPWQQRLGT